MSDYAHATNFTAKDALVSGNPAKTTKGSEIDAELVLIETAVNSKVDKYSAAAALTTLSVGDMLSVYDNAGAAYKRITVANARLQLTPFTDTAFFAVGTGAQAVAISTLTRVNLQTENYDAGANFTPGTPGIYTIPVSGSYYFFGGILYNFGAVSSTATTELEIRSAADALISGVIMAQQVVPAAALSPFPTGFYVYTGAVAGQRISLSAFQTNGAVTLTNANCIFGGWRIA